ncbi:MAG: type I restriction-modification enzyme R subunit C-terminal domain-containing protein [Candidatus Binatia bacterium]
MARAFVVRFRDKARQFLRAHADHLSTRKLRTNAPLTASDLADLERMLAEAGIGTAADVERAKRESQGLGLFVRTLVGLDREAAKTAAVDSRRDPAPRGLKRAQSKPPAVRLNTVTASPTPTSPSSTTRK